MIREQIRAEVDSIDPLDRMEQDTITEALAWIDGGDELCRIEKPATPPRHLVSYFVPLDGEHLLLVDHRNAQLWLPAGGHVEPGEHPRETVRREADEELGITAEFLLDGPVMITCTETVGRTPGHTDVSLWYLLAGDRTGPLVYDTSEFSTVMWFHSSAIPLQRSDPHMGRFLRKLALLRERNRL